MSEKKMTAAEFCTLHGIEWDPMSCAPYYVADRANLPDISRTRLWVTVVLLLTCVAGIAYLGGKHQPRKCPAGDACPHRSVTAQ